MKALVWQRWDELPPCWVCGGRAPYVHEGRYYCVRSECQCVAAGTVSVRYARDQQRRRGLRVHPAAPCATCYDSGTILVHDDWQGATTDDYHSEDCPACRPGVARTPTTTGGTA